MAIFYEGTFVDGTSDTDHVLLVQVPAFGPDALVGDPDGVVWTPIEGRPPQAGDRALVVESDKGAWWAIAWWSPALYAPDEQ